MGGLLGPCGLKVELRKKARKQVKKKSRDVLILGGAGARGWTPGTVFCYNEFSKVGVLQTLCPGILITLYPYGVRRISRAMPSAAGPLSTGNW